MDNGASNFSMVDPSDISKLVRKKDKDWLRDHGGIEGVVIALESDLENGIRGDSSDIERRRKTFGSNLIPEYNLQKWYLFLFEAVKDPRTVCTLISALLSLCLKIQKQGLKQGYENRVENFLVIILAVFVSQQCNFFSTNLCLKYSKISSSIPDTNVVRSSRRERVPICEVVVGDIVFLKPGDQVPADGVYIDGYSLQTEMVKADQQIDQLEVNDHENPFLSYGSTVVDGCGRMLVTAVGHNRKHHMIYFRGSLIDELQSYTSVVELFCMIVVLLTFMVLYWRISPCRIDVQRENFLPFCKIKGIGYVVMAIFGVMSTLTMIIALTSTPIGLVLAAKITLAFSMSRLTEKKILVRKTSICNSVSSVTTICMNKTGTLTNDYMKVTNFWQGFNSFEEVAHNWIAPNVLELLCQGIGLNTVTNSTDEAIREWAVKHLNLDEEIVRNCTILETEPFNSKYRQSGVLISKNDDNTIHIHRKGDAEVILSICSHYYDNNGIVKVIDKICRALLEKILQGMAENGLRCIAFAHRKTSISDHLIFSHQQFILLGFVGLTNSCRSGIRRTIEDCQISGLQVKLITGDNTITAITAAIKCGILKPDYQPGEVIEGEEFRDFTFEERLEKVENIRVLTRATPDDKAVMVRCLKENGHVVAFLGSGIGDAKALREAEVGLCFGTQGAEIAKACSPIVMLRKDFDLIIDIFKWGKRIYENIQIYTEVMLLATYVALVMDFFVAASASELPSLDAVESGTTPSLVSQFVIRNFLTTLLLMLLLLLLPSEGDMQIRPRNLKEPLLMATSHYRILAKALYLIAVLLAIHFKGESLFNTKPKEKEYKILFTYIMCLLSTAFATRPVMDYALAEMTKRKRFYAVMGLISYILTLMGNTPDQQEMFVIIGAAPSIVYIVFMLPKLILKMG